MTGLRRTTFSEQALAIITNTEVVLCLVCARLRFGVESSDDNSPLQSTGYSNASYLLHMISSVTSAKSPGSERGRAV